MTIITLPFSLYHSHSIILTLPFSLWSGATLNDVEKVLDQVILNGWHQQQHQLLLPLVSVVFVMEVAAVVTAAAVVISNVVIH